MGHFIGLDFETQGLDPKLDLPVEVALVAFDENFKELFAHEWIIKSAGQKPQTQELIDLTHITDEMISNGKDESEVTPLVADILASTDAIFAYNAPFDKGFLKAMLARQGYCLSPSIVVVDCMRDVGYPSRFTCKKLSHLAYDHGIVAPPDTLHRAVEDVRLMIKLLSKYDLKAVVKLAAEPKVQVRIMVPPPWQDKDGVPYAKSLGFRFESEQKSWLKVMSESAAEELGKDCKYALQLNKLAEI